MVGSFSRRNASATVPHAAPNSISAAIGRGVPSVSRPTAEPLSAASRNCSVPISAEALPALAPWRDSAPTVALGSTNPMQVITTRIGRNTLATPNPPLNARPHSTRSRAR